MGTIKLFCFLGEDVAVLVNFHQEITYELLMDGVFCTGVIAEGDAPPFEEIHHFFVISVC